MKKPMLLECTLQYMFDTLINSIVEGFETPKFYWKDGEDKYHEIVEVDLMRSRFITDNQDFSEYEWELAESRIYEEVKTDD